MITYKEYALPNGLTVLANRDRESKMAAVNLLYRVGSVNEDPGHTGFAHLFEHLMFRGTRRVPDFDLPVQRACGESNAFTCNDYTDYYIVLPKDNIATAFWLEADRMTGLDISPDGLETEKMVVVEEYNQRFVNQPYGDHWLLLRSLIYKEHPYRWSAIGLTPDHVRNAGMEQVRSFYNRYYHPSNAILSVSADMEAERVFGMAEEWFGDIPSGEVPHDVIPDEPEQCAPRRMEVDRNVPSDQVTLAFLMEGRTDREFFLCDFLTDILAGGFSARLYERLVKERQLFSTVNAFVSGDVRSNMFVVTGRLVPGVTVEQAEEALWGELERLKGEPVAEREAEKVKNKFEANTLFGELNVMNKAMNLGFYNMLGDTELINGEIPIFRSVSPQEIIDMARCRFVPERCSTLVMRSKR